MKRKHIKNKSKNPDSDLKNQDFRLTPGKKRLFIVILTILPVAFFLLIEAFLILFKYGGNLDLFVPRKSGVIEEYVLNEQFTKRYFFQKGIKTPVPLSQSFPAVKDESTFRIFCLGASTTQGFPYPPTGAFPAMLQHILSAYFPERNIEVLNCGITAITSFSVLDMEKEILKKYQPDLLIVYSGHNEFYGVFGQASTLSLFRNRNLLNLFLGLQRSRLVLLLRNITTEILGKTVAPENSSRSRTMMSLMAKDIGIDWNNDVFRQTLDYYQKNLEDMCRIAGKNQTPIMLCNLVDNKRDLAPFSSTHCFDFVKKDTTGWRQNMYAGEELLTRKQFREAADKFRNAVAIDSMYALTHFRIGQCHFALNDFQTALYYFDRAKDFDTIRFRAPSAFNRILKKVALNRQVPLIDVLETFRKKSKGAVPGNNLLHEHVHPKLYGYFLIAKTIAEQMEQEGHIAKNWDRRQEKPDSVYLASCFLTPLDLEVAGFTIFRLTSQWPFHLQDPSGPYQPAGDERTLALAQEFVDGGEKSLAELHLDYGNELYARNDVDSAVREYRVALAISPHEAIYNRLGRVYLKEAEIAYRDRDDFEKAYSAYRQGFKYFTEGLKRWPDNLEMNFNLGLLCMMRKDQFQTAKDQFLKVIRLNPGHKNAHKLLVELSIRQKDYDGAISILHSAIQQFPEEAAFYTDMGFVFFLENRVTESERFLKKAIEIGGDSKAKLFLERLQSKKK